MIQIASIHGVKLYQTCIELVVPYSSKTISGACKLRGVSMNSKFCFLFMDCFMTRYPILLYNEPLLNVEFYSDTSVADYCIN